MSKKQNNKEKNNARIKREKMQEKQREKEAQLKQKQKKEKEEAKKQKQEEKEKLKKMSKQERKEYLKKKKQEKKNDGAPLKTKLMIVFLPLFLFLSIGLSVVNFIMTRNNINTSINKELQKLSNSVHITFKSLISFAMKNFLRGVSDKNTSIAEDYYELHDKGLFSKKAAKNRLIKLFKDQKIGKTGDVFIADISKNRKNPPFVIKPPIKIFKKQWIPMLKKAISNVYGYLEFDHWYKNRKTRRSVYYNFIRKWNWIIFIIADKEEVKNLINIEDISADLLTLKIEKNGYASIMDTKGNLLVHPWNQNENVYDLEDARGTKIFQKMIEKKNGKLTYYWDYGQGAQESLMYFKYVPDMKLIIWLTTALDDHYIILYKSLRITVLVLIVSIILIIPVIIISSGKLIKPLNGIVDTLEEITESRDFKRVNVRGNQEVVHLGKAFNVMISEIEHYTQNLENLVAERTAELNKSLEDVKALNEQQAGDYFLTSLLINPLMSKSYKSEIIEVGFFLKQKKQFEFRNRKGEIGGDINIVHTIQLRNKNFTVFVNGDAMGKSLQGAGGALVLGVVFNAFIARTKIMKSAQYLTPERWLKECYNELQSVFVSFDGSMLISVVMGMVDDISGFMYYYNTEHPWTVLYRDGKADFTQEELDTRKIGTMIEEGGIKIRTLQLEVGDMVFLGSDGRDDIMTGVDEETGFRIINEDEYAFLEFVEKADGDINKIIEMTKDWGEFTDDYSLIKIHFVNEPEWKKGKNQPGFASNRDKATQAFENGETDKAIEYFEAAVDIYPDEECLKDLARCYKSKRMHEQELSVIQKIIWFYPGIANLPAVYRASLLNKKLGNYHSATDYGETFRRYNPEHIKNLINLADIYRLMKAVPRAKELLDKVEALDPSNKYLSKLRDLLDNQAA